MTAEVGARSEVSQVLEKCGLACEDLAKGGARVGDGISLPKGKEIDSEGACGSYVMINCSDEIADDSVHVDPNREVELECFGNGNVEIDAEPKIENGNDPKFCVSEEIGCVGHAVGKDLGASASNWLMNDIEVGNNVYDGAEKQGEDTETESSEKVEEIPKSDDAADDNCNYPQTNCKEDKHNVKIMSDSNGIIGEFGELKSSMTHTDAFVPEQNGDAVGKDDNGYKLNASHWLMNDIEVGNNVYDGAEKQGEETETESSEKVEEIPKSEDAAADNCNYPQTNCKEDKHNVKIVSDSNGIIGEFGELKSSMTHTDAFVPEQNGDAVDKDDNGYKLNASPNKNEEDVPYDEKNLILDEKHLVVNGEDSVVGRSGDKEEELEQNLVTVPTIEVSVLLERDNVDHSISHGSGVCLPSGQDQVGNPQTAEDVKSEYAYDDCDIVSGETCATLIDSATKMDIVGERPFEEHALVMENSSAESSDKDTCHVDDTDAQAKGSISHVRGDCLAARQDQDGDPQYDDHEIVSGETCGISIDSATKMDIVGEWALENHALVLEKSPQDSETDTCPIDDKDAQAEGSICDDKGDELPTSPEEDIASNTSMCNALVLDSQNILEGNRQLENTVMTSSIVMVGSVEINCKKVFPSFNNAAIKSFQFSPAVENLRLVMKVKSSLERIDNHDSCCLRGTKIEAKSENGTVDEDTQSGCLSIDQENVNHESDVNEVESNGSTCQEVKVVDEINWDLSIGTDTAEPLNVVGEVGSGPFYFVRIPRYEDEFIQEKIKYAQSLIDEKTRIRDSFRDQIQTTKAACKELGSNVNAAKSEARAARESLKLKRKEIETAQSMINKAKDAISIDDIGIRINKMEYKIAHETLQLKEEKQLIRDIKQLTQLRDQLSLDAGKQGELQLALDQKGEVEERLTLLRKEMDLSKANVLKADELTTSVLKKYDVERETFDGLQAQFEEANKIRQEAYVHLQCLKKPSHEKHKYLRKYKNDMEEAHNLALRKDGEKLQAHAINQVETFMERWNNDDEFRKDYIRCNTRSTLRRLGTIDGRSLAPDEERPVLENVIKERAAADNLVSPGLTVEQNKPAGQVETVKDNREPAKGVKKKNQETETKNPEAAVSTLPDDQASVSGGVELVDTKDSSGLDFADTREEDKRSKEEDELEKRAEELRKEEEAIRLTEQLKLEEKAKAEIALARKKRKAEKAQARAAIRAQKEAEEKQREKEKKARRKKKKSAGGEAKNEADTEGEPDVSMETPTDTQKEPENDEKSKATSTKSQKHPQSTKQNKAKPIIPPPLLKRGKRKMETWMWILLTVVVVLALFFLGNSNCLRKI